MQTEQLVNLKRRVYEDIVMAKNWTAAAADRAAGSGR